MFWGAFCFNRRTSLYPLTGDLNRLVVALLAAVFLNAFRNSFQQLQSRVYTSPKITPLHTQLL